MSNNIPTTSDWPLVWDLSPLQPGDGSDEAFAADLVKTKRVADEFGQRWRERGDYLTDSTVLAEALAEYEKWQRADTGRALAHAWLQSQQDMRDTATRARLARAEKVAEEIANDLLFFTHQLARVPIATQNLFLKTPTLAPYHYFLVRLFADARYLLPEGEEKIINLYSGPAWSHWQQLMEKLLSREERLVLVAPGREEIKSFAGLFGLLESPTQTVRDSVALALDNIFSVHLDTAEAELNAILTTKRVNDDLRQVTRPDQLRHLADDIDSKVVDTLVATVTERFDLPRRYYALKAKLLGKSRLAYHDRVAPIGELPKGWTYARAVEMVSESFSALDDEFAKIFHTFVSSGQIDVAPRLGKDSGASCWHGSLTQPTYILLNHTDSLSDVLTLAHEAGHGINNELVRGCQPALYFGTPTSTAEVASTFFEDFVLERLLEKTDEAGRLAILMAQLDREVATTFRQIAFYRFEQELHMAHRIAGYLAKEQINALFLKQMGSYLGDAVEQPDSAGRWWIYVSHFRQPFYVYSYASGLLISKALQKLVREDKSKVKEVKEFLSAGLSASPREIFAKLGIDIADPDFWQSGLAEFDRRLTEAETLATKVNLR
jgi:oligoendopeptidase F